MNRKVRSRVARRGNTMVNLPSNPEIGNDKISLNQKALVDWTTLPDGLVIELFSCLNYRDRASLSSTCRSWRLLGNSSCLWQSLDLRLHKCNAQTATSLASRCSNLWKLRFRGEEAALALRYLEARSLREISGDHCTNITDATLVLITIHHNALESIQLGPELCESIQGKAIQVIAEFCRKLRKLHLSGIREVDDIAVNALARNCHNLSDISFLNCLNVDVKSLGNVVSIRFLSVAGTSNIKPLSEHWSKLPNLICLDVSRTNIVADDVFKLLFSSKSLKVMCALDCPALEDDASFVAHKNNKDKLLITLSTDIFKGVASLFTDPAMNERNVFSNWRNSNDKDRNLNEIMTWLEWILSHSLLCIAESNSWGFDNYWLNQGVALLVTLTKSSQEDVQEMAATALAILVVVSDDNASIDYVRSEAVIRDGGILQLLHLSKSWREGLQSVATKAIANLSVNPKIAKAIAKDGGISILVNLVRSMNRSVVEDAATGLWNLSVEEHKNAIAEAGGLQALVDQIFKWATGGDKILELAAGTLANLAVDDKCSVLIADIGGLNALVRLVRSCKCVGVQEQIIKRDGIYSNRGSEFSYGERIGISIKRGSEFVVG